MHSSQLLLRRNKCLFIYLCLAVCLILQISCKSEPVKTTVSFVRLDTTTQGSWKGTYGGNGFSIAGEKTSYPNYVQVKNDQRSTLWAESSTERRALQKFLEPGRIPGHWYNFGTFELEIHFKDAKPHEVAFYFLDWDSKGARAQTVELLDGDTNSVLDSRSVARFEGGQYLVWNMTGHVKVRLTRTGGANAVLSGIFFGPRR